MTFQEIFNKDGLYTSTSFVKGFAFEIIEGTLYQLHFKSPNDFLPRKVKSSVYKELFTKEYTKVLNINSLFK